MRCVVTALRYRAVELDELRSEERKALQEIEEVAEQIGLPDEDSDSDPEEWAVQEEASADRDIGGNSRGTDQV